MVDQKERTKKECEEADGHVPPAHLLRKNQTAGPSISRIDEHFHATSMVIMAEAKAVSLAAFAKHLARASTRPRGGYNLAPGKNKYDLISLPWRIGKTRIAFESNKRYLKTWKLMNDFRPCRQRWR